jgi:hypothetical protein
MYVLYLYICGTGVGWFGINYYWEVNYKDSKTLTIYIHVLLLILSCVNRIYFVRKYKDLCFDCLK